MQERKRKVRTKKEQNLRLLIYPKVMRFCLVGSFVIIHHQNIPSNNALMFFFLFFFFKRAYKFKRWRAIKVEKKIWRERWNIRRKLRKKKYTHTHSKQRIAASSCMSFYSQKYNGKQFLQLYIFSFKINDVACILWDGKWWKIHVQPYLKLCTEKQYSKTDEWRKKGNKK